MLKLKKGGRLCTANFRCEVCECEFSIPTNEAMKFDSDGSTVYIGDDAMPHVKPNLTVFHKCPSCGFNIYTTDVEIGDKVAFTDDMKPDPEKAEEIHRKIMEKYGSPVKPEKEKSKFERYLKGE